MRFTRTSVIGTDSSFQFVGAQDAVSLGDHPFPMHPLGLNPIEAKWVHGEKAMIEADPPLTAAELGSRVYAYFESCEGPAWIGLSVVHFCSVVPH